MTVPSTARRAGPYVGTGAPVNYPFSFKVFAKEDIEVTLAVIATGADSVGVLDSDYSVSLNADQDATPGGYVTYQVGGVNTALPATLSLTVTGLGLPYEQTADLPQGGNFNAGVVENALDNLEMQIQNQRDQLDLTLRLSVATPPNVDSTLPGPVPFNLIGWDAVGQQLINYDGTATAPVVAAGLAALTASFNQFVAALASATTPGATLITEKRTDIAGAVMLTLHDWNLRDRVNVRQVGVVGDGSTNDAALLNALGALGVPLFIPYTSAGYKINSTVTFNCDVYCEGFFVPDAAIGAAPLAQNRFAVVLPSAGFGVGRRFHGIKVQGSGALRTAGVNGIRNDCEDSTMRECRAPVLNYGIVVRSYSITVDRCSAQLCNVPFAAYARSTSLEINALSIRGGTYDSAIMAAMIIGDDSWPDALGSLSLTAAPSAGATSATLAAPWAFPSGPYPVSFFRVSDLVKEVRTVTFTNGATSATWAGGLSANSSAIINVTGGQHGVNIDIGNGVSIDGSELRVDNVSSVKVSLYAEGSTSAQAIRLGGAGDGLTRDVEIGKCYFSTLQYAVRCYSAVEGLVVRPSFYTAVSRSALYVTSDIYRVTYERGTAVASFTQGQEVHTGFRSVPMTFGWLTILHQGLISGAQNCTDYTGAWYPGGLKQLAGSLTRMNASANGRFYDAPSLTKAGTVASNVFTFTNVADCYAFNGGDTIATAPVGATKVRSVDYATGTMVMDSGTTANGAATVSQVITSFV